MRINDYGYTMQCVRNTDANKIEYTINFYKNKVFTHSIRILESEIGVIEKAFPKYKLVSDQSRSFNISVSVPILFPLIQI